MTVLWRVLQMQVKLKEQGLSTKNISFSIYFENKLAKLRDAIANLIRYCTPSLAEWLVLRYLELQVGVCRGTWYCRSGFAGTRRGGHVTSPPTPRHASDCPNPVCNILLEHTPIKIQPRFNFVSLNACWSTTCMHN